MEKIPQKTKEKYKTTKENEHWQTNSHNSVYLPAQTLSDKNKEIYIYILTVERDQLDAIVSTAERNVVPKLSFYSIFNKTSNQLNTKKQVTD